MNCLFYFQAVRVLKSNTDVQMLIRYFPYGKLFESDTMSDDMGT